MLYFLFVRLFNVFIKNGNVFWRFLLSRWPNKKNPNISFLFRFVTWKDSHSLKFIGSGKKTGWNFFFLPEWKCGQRPIGFVTGWIAHGSSPKIIFEHIQNRRLSCHVPIMCYSRNVVVYEITKISIYITSKSDGNHSGIFLPITHPFHFFLITALFIFNTKFTLLNFQLGIFRIVIRVCFALVALGVFPVRIRLRGVARGPWYLRLLPVAFVVLKEASEFRGFAAPGGFVPAVAFHRSCARIDPKENAHVCYLIRVPFDDTIITLV